MTTIRTLPLRLAPVLGEALDSWLDAYAHRLQTTLGDFAAALGLPTMRYRAGGSYAQDWTVNLLPTEAETVAYACGTDRDTVHALTLARFDGRALHLRAPEQRRVDPAALWGRAAGSRFCPSCLAHQDGRWQLIWRLGWAFACPTHHCLLADDCPHCQRPTRSTRRSLVALPDPRRCTRNAIGSRGPVSSRCEGLLTDATTLALPQSHPVLDAQRLLWETLENGTARFGRYSTDPQPVAAMLADLRLGARKIIQQGIPDRLAAQLPADVLDAYHYERHRHSHQPGCTPVPAEKYVRAGHP